MFIRSLWHSESPCKYSRGFLAFPNKELKGLKRSRGRFPRRKNLLLSFPKPSSALKYFLIRKWMRWTLHLIPPRKETVYFHSNKGSIYRALIGVQLSLVSVKPVWLLHWFLTIKYGILLASRFCSVNTQNMKRSILKVLHWFYLQF